MSVVCSHCRNYVPQEHVSCPVCGQNVVAAPPYTQKDFWKEAWQLDKHQLPLFLLIGVVLGLMFLFVIFSSR